MSSMYSSCETRIGGFSPVVVRGSGGVSCLGGIWFMGIKSIRLPMSWRLEPNDTGLLVIDVQDRLLPAMVESEARLKKIVTAVRVARLFGLPVFHTEQAPEKLGATAAAVREALGPAAPPPRLRRTFSKADCFTLDELPPTLLVAGLETHVCVRQTVFDLSERGTQVYLLADAVSSRAEIDHRLAVHEMREVAGARITTVETVAWELLVGAEGEIFKNLLALLK